LNKKSLPAMLGTISELRSATLTQSRLDYQSNQATLIETCLEGSMPAKEEHVLSGPCLEKLMSRALS